MKITLEATGTIERVNGVEARVWRGATESGIAVVCWIALIQVPNEADTAEFDRALRAVKAERRLASFDMRLVI